MKAYQKVIVVTGAGSGIGRELVFLLLAKGAKIAAVDINEVSLHETASFAGDGAELALFEADVAHRDEVEPLLGRVVERFGAVDGVVNDAGIIQPMVKVGELNYTTIDRVLAVNLHGVINMTKTFLPHLMQRPEAHIVNISSMGGFLPVPGQTVYGASKAAVKLFTEGLHSELRDSGVNVTVVFPGAVATNIAVNSGLGDLSASLAGAKVPPMMQPAAAARRIVQGMESDRYQVILGRDARLMDVLYRLDPRRAAALIYGQMRSLLQV